MESANRPEYFVGDGDRFSDIHFWLPCIQFGLEMIIVECVCDAALLDLRYDNHGRGMPNTWQSISERYKELIEWDRAGDTNYVHHVKLDTSNKPCYKVVLEELVPKLDIEIPCSIFESQSFDYNDVVYESFHNLLSANVLGFL